jgi:hypothetical protein
MFTRKRTADDVSATAAAAVAAEAAAGVKTKRKRLGITSIDEEAAAAAAAAQLQQLDLEPAAVTAAALAADDEALAAAHDEHEAPSTEKASAKKTKKAGGRPKRKHKRGFAGVRSVGRAAGLPAGQPSAAAAAERQRPVTRRRPLSYDARKHNLSAPAPLPYFKPRQNGKFFVPEPEDEAGDEQLQE